MDASIWREGGGGIIFLVSISVGGLVAIPPAAPEVEVESESGMVFFA